MASLQLTHDTSTQEEIPALKHDRERTVRKADKPEGMARKLEKEWRHEKAMSGSSLERVKQLGDEIEGLRAERIELEPIEEKRNCLPSHELTDDITT